MDESIAGLLKQWFGAHVLQAMTVVVMIDIVRSCGHIGRGYYRN
ncbi:MAG TPA: hypothetical protein VJ734_08585 [Nitrosospira sp.]|nr:hypothetical protein [Nitrosospira sp.]